MRCERPPYRPAPYLPLTRHTPPPPRADKCGAALADAQTKEQLEERFRDIQNAYEVLSNPAKRREFDSTDSFDDSLPSSCADGDFFKVFGAAFKRQARWSDIKPVPDVGNDKTAMREVQRCAHVFPDRCRLWLTGGGTCCQKRFCNRRRRG